MSDNSDSDEWLTVGEAVAKLPGIKASTVRKLVAEGKLEAIRLDSGHRRISAASVEGYRRELLGRRGAE